MIGHIELVALDDHSSPLQLALKQCSGMYCQNACAVLRACSFTRPNSHANVASRYTPHIISCVLKTQQIIQDKVWQHIHS